MRCNRFPWIHRWYKVSRREFDLAYPGQSDELGLPDEWLYRVCVRCGEGRMTR